MLKRIEKYMKDRLDKVVFIELKKDAHIGDPKFEILKDIPIPMNINELVKPIKEGDTDYNLSLAGMARGMIFVIGLDCDFKYIQDYKKFLYAFDTQIEDYISYEGLKLAEEGKFYDALIYFKALITLDENNINGLYNCARCCQDIASASENKEKKKDFKREAIEILEIITEKYPDFSLAYYHLGFHYANQNLFKKAQLTWEKCLSLDIDEEKRKEILFQMKELKDQIQYEEGYTYILNNQPDLGIEKLLPLLEKYSDWWNLLFFVGLGYRQLGNIQEAINYLKKILTIKPTQVDTLNELGLCYASIYDFDKAEKYFRKALQFKENDSEILANLGMVYMESGKLDLAREVLEKSMQINPNDEITKQCIQKLNLM
ncbi:tetratricopeptide repeat protein [Crassaminicella thermophila]|uniref:Tetratricopeptide repeat protein n=1 Tax=Crassaminicella thermophila TaxID=2599308 RepID=A0A5C0SDW2_CRATE|nr:tetratricopeptide repeat protein [Crassaminicella thermophila]QEK12471.1 tetratricopeptide repeat protein [Crassaminicella thermophila]